MFTIPGTVHVECGRGYVCLLGFFYVS